MEAGRFTEDKLYSRADLVQDRPWFSSHRSPGLEMGISVMG